MLYGQIIIIRVRDGKVQEVTLNIQQRSVIVLNEDTGEYEYPVHRFKNAEELNTDLYAFPEGPTP